MPVTKAVTMFEARVVHGPDLENSEWSELLWPETDAGVYGSDFDTVLDEARECFESEPRTGILVIAEIVTKYHVIV